MDTCPPETCFGWAPGPPIMAAREVSMRVDRQRQDDGSLLIALIDDAGHSVAIVSGFLRYLTARGCSPNTLTAYAYDLRHLWTFLAEQQLEWDELRPRHALGLLEYLRSVPSRSPRQRFA